MKLQLDYLTEQFTALVAERVSAAPAGSPVVAGLAGGQPTCDKPVEPGRTAEAGPAIAKASDSAKAPLDKLADKPGSVTPATPTAAPTPPPIPIQSVAHALKGYHFDATVGPDQVVAAAKIADQVGFALDTITGVDWIAQNELEVVYDYFHPISPLRVVVRARLPRANPELPTIAGVFPGANWHEREAHDFFGIRFAGHPNLKPFLLPEDADFHPLLKDYKP